MQLSQAQSSLFTRAKQVSQAGQVDYAISLLEPLVKEVPEFLEARKLLRTNEMRKTKGESSMGGNMKIQAIKAAAAAGKKTPIELMAIAEDILKVDPTSSQGNQLLAEGAAAMGLPLVRIYAYETLVESKPNDLPSLRNLGYALLENGESKRAIEVFQRALSVSPNDGEATRGLKDASAMNAQSSGGWEEKGDFRAALKDSSEAVRLEQASRAVTSDEAIDAQIAEIYSKLDQAAPDRNIVRKIAELYEKKKDLPLAIQWYDYAYEVSGRADAALQRNADRLRAHVLEETFKVKENALQNAATPEEKAVLQAELDSLRKQRAEQTVVIAKERVDKYPNELQLRYEYARALLDVGRHEEAIPELQQAIRQPNVRQQALILLGQCFWRGKMLPLAKKQFETADSEIVGMDDIKKEAIYNLALVKQEMNDKEGYSASLMKIYEIDSQYRDVAQRIKEAMSAA